MKTEYEEGVKPKGIKEKVIRHPRGVERIKNIQTRPVSKVAKVLTPIWMIASIIFIVYCFNVSIALTLGAVGQFLFGCSVSIAYYNKHPGAIISAVMFALLCICAFGFYFSGESLQILLAAQIFPIVLISFFFCSGIGMMLYSFKANILKKGRCTLSIMAKSVYISKESIDVKRRNITTSVKMWMSHFQYYYNGNYYYCDCIAVPASYKKPSLNENREIFINPNKPEEYWSRASDGFEIYRAFINGIPFVAFGLLGLCLWYFNA